MPSSLPSVMSCQSDQATLIVVSAGPSSSVTAWASPSSMTTPSPPKSSFTRLPGIQAPASLSGSAISLLSMIVSLSLSPPQLTLAERRGQGLTSVSVSTGLDFARETARRRHDGRPGRPAAFLRLGLGMDAAEAIHEKFVAKVGTGTLPRRDQRRPAGRRRPRPRGDGRALLQPVRQPPDGPASRAGCRRAARASTRSAARATRTMPRSPRRSGSTTWPSSTTARTPSRSTASKKLPGQTPCWDMLLSFAASAEDPISGGRHKVLGSQPLFIPPQTSTIASHLPKAVGAAFSIGIARTLKLEDTRAAARFDRPAPASATPRPTIRPRRARSTRAAWAAYQGTPMPLVFLCEDNGIGISTRTPRGWIEAAFQRPGRAQLCALQRPRHGRRLSRRARGRRLCPQRAQARLPAHGLRAALRPCRLRRAGHLSQQGADRGGRGARSPALQRRLAGRAGPASGREHPRHLQRDRGDGSPGSPSRRSPGPSSPPARR